MGAPQNLEDFRLLAADAWASRPADEFDVGQLVLPLAGIPFQFSGDARKCGPENDILPGGPSWNYYPSDRRFDVSWFGKTMISYDLEFEGQRVFPVEVANVQTCCWMNFYGLDLLDDPDDVCFGIGVLSNELGESNRHASFYLIPMKLD